MELETNNVSFGMIAEVLSKMADEKSDSERIVFYAEWKERYREAAFKHMHTDIMFTGKYGVKPKTVALLTLHETLIKGDSL